MVSSLCMSACLACCFSRLTEICQTLEHHFSIAYGRPPIIHEDPAITQHNTFTQSSSVSQGDLRLHSQVDLFIILTRIYFAFGPDVDLEVPESEFPKIDQFDMDLGDWKTAWLPRLGESLERAITSCVRPLLTSPQSEADMLVHTPTKPFTCTITSPDFS